MNNEVLRNIDILMELQHQSIQIVYQTIIMLCTSIAATLLVMIAIVIKTVSSGEVNPLLSIFIILSLGAGAVVNAHFLLNEYQDLLNLKLKQAILKRKKEKIINLNK